MDIELLRTFLEVKNTRHFGKAAENLYLTQAAVSARIKQLENILGTPLFTRFRNNLQLTVTGERLINHAETVLIAWERARQDLTLKKKQKHVIGLGATTGLWDLLFQDTLHKVYKNHPELALRAEAHGPETLIRYLMERTLDLALIYEPAKLNNLISIPIAPAELILVSSNENATVDSAMASCYVSIDWGLPFQMSYAQLFPDSAPPALHTTLSRIALDFLLEFGGSAYLPYRMVESFIGTSLFQVQEAPVITRQIYACYHRDNIYTKEIESILNVIRSLEIPVENVPESIEI
ncbi:MAG: DNA-binding transcriptional LysR family regulator [Oleiphilaceae bacterium]|jgi:DNA-binding transcriptional LysR family regulator